MRATTTTSAQPPAPAVVTDYAPKCKACGRTLAAQVSRPWTLVCHKCRVRNSR